MVDTIFFLLASKISQISYGYFAVKREGDRERERETEKGKKRGREGECYDSVTCFYNLICLSEFFLVNTCGSTPLCVKIS